MYTHLPYLGSHMNKKVMQRYTVEMEMASWEAHGKNKKWYHACSSWLGTGTWLPQEPGMVQWHFKHLLCLNEGTATEALRKSEQQPVCSLTYLLQ
ncbi:hypothetical protein V6N13_112323 [Hibiscus sabdariffa]|uniref:Uncharacterized protein n=1 Tax=Hibiscus sabdariffa TaxID=183260 RepID=A0ABR2TNE5_9ROSI